MSAQIEQLRTQPDQTQKVLLAEMERMDANRKAEIRAAVSEAVRPYLNRLDDVAARQRAAEEETAQLQRKLRETEAALEAERSRSWLSRLMKRRRKD